MKLRIQIKDLINKCLTKKNFNFDLFKLGSLQAVQVNLTI